MTLNSLQKFLFFLLIKILLAWEFTQNKIATKHFEKIIQLKIFCDFHCLHTLFIHEKPVFDM